MTLNACIFSFGSIMLFFISVLISGFSESVLRTFNVTLKLFLIDTGISYLNPGYPGSNLTSLGVIVTNPSKI